MARPDDLKRFTTDLERVTAETEEMNDADPEMVPGGAQDGCGNDEWCLTSWHRFATTLHNDAQERHHACWTDYGCVAVSENPMLKH